MVTQLVHRIAGGLLRGSGIRRKAAVAQMLAIPMPLTLDKYRNARSSSNPDGDLRPLWAFRELVDAVPEPSVHYIPGADSIESIYGSIVNGSTIAPDATYTAEVFKSARKKFTDANAFPALDGLTQSWRPVYAVPENWYDLVAKGALVEMMVDLHDETNAMLQAPIWKDDDIHERWYWHVNVDGRISRHSFDPATSLHALRINYLEVVLHRPWFDFFLLKLAGWTLGGQRQGLISSGDGQANNAIMPLVPVAVLIGRRAELVGNLSDRDNHFVEMADDPSVQVSLGPFSIGTRSTANDCFVIGFISMLVPLAPPTDSWKSSAE